LNRYFFDFTISSLLIYKKRNLFIFLMLTLLLFLSSSILFVSSSLKTELIEAADELPQIIVQKRIGGRLRDIELEKIPFLVSIEGVERIVPRMWGLYRFEKLGMSFSIVGIDRFDYDYLHKLRDAAKILQKDPKDGMVVGQGVYDALQKSYYKSYFNFLLPEGGIKRLNIVGVFDTKNRLLSNDMILLNTQNARKILGIKEGYATDLALYVPNPKEISTIAAKIRLLDPSLFVLTKEDIKTGYEEMFDLKSGLFLLLFIMVLVTFFMIVSDRLSALNSQEKREIAILKAIGWSVRDVLKEKFLESFFIASMAYFVGVALALVYVFVSHAPLLDDLFMGSFMIHPPLVLDYHVAPSTYLLLFLVSVPVYLAAVIIPAWRVAVSDVDEVIR